MLCIDCGEDTGETWKTRCFDCHKTWQRKQLEKAQMKK